MGKGQRTEETHQRMPLENLIKIQKPRVSVCEGERERKREYKAGKEDMREMEPTERMPTGIVLHKCRLNILGKCLGLHIRAHTHFSSAPPISGTNDLAEQK